MRYSRLTSCNSTLPKKVDIVFYIIWAKASKNGATKIRGRQPLKNLKVYGLLKQIMSLQIFQRLFSTNFIWSILEYFVA